VFLYVFLITSNLVKSVAHEIEAITLITLVTLCDGPEPSGEVPRCLRVLVGVSVPMAVEGGTHHRAVLLTNLGEGHGCH
jgi:hypothetical protein